MQTKK
jgi:hypothetical protein